MVSTQLLLERSHVAAEHVPCMLAALAVVYSSVGIAADTAVVDDIALDTVDAVSLQSRAQSLHY